MTAGFLISDCNQLIFTTAKPDLFTMFNAGHPVGLRVHRFEMVAQVQLCFTQLAACRSFLAVSVALWAKKFQRITLII